MRAAPGSIPAISTRRLLDAIDAAGASTVAALASAGLTPAILDGTDARVPLAAQYRLWEIAVAATGDRALPLAIARAYDVHTYDVLGFACATAPDLSTAYERLVRFLGLWVEGERAELLRTPRGARLVFHHDLPRSPGRQLAAESSLAKIVFAGRRATGVELSPASVSFAHPPPPDPAAHAAFFACPVRFDASAYEIELSTATLALPLRRADPHVAAFFERAATSLLREADGGVTARVRDAIARALPAGAPTEDAVARVLGLGARTMRRRLAEEGHTFRGLLDDVRRILAEGYLRAPGMSVAETAFLVGFADVANFHRAFRRWTGFTPGEFRQRS